MARPTSGDRRREVALAAAIGAAAAVRQLPDHLAKRRAAGACLAALRVFLTEDLA